MFYTLLMPACMLCVLLFLSSCARVEPPSTVERPGGIRPSSTETTHIVVDGDTTLIVANKYDMREDELVRINNIQPPFTLIKGQKLKIKPNSKNKPTEPTFERVQEEKEVEVTALNISPAKGIDGFATAGSATGSLTDAATALPQQAGQQPFSPPEGSPAADKMAINPTGWQAPVTRGTVLYRFGDKLPNGTTCDGATWKAPVGTPVMAASQGTILKAGQEVPAYGNMVVIKHPDGKLSVYAHLKQIDKGIKVNQPVAKGQMLGQVGQSGQVNDPQLHFQIRSGDAKRAAIDPMTLIS